MTSYQSNASIGDEEAIGYDDKLDNVQTSIPASDDSNLTSLLDVPKKPGHKPREQNKSNQQAATDLGSSKGPCCIIL
eukprot:CAMPEP_0201569668 /NCGR_PEP_ID=MMETSP0190_2-20130828/11485_1 /ASSEMBLY_ACC=CAM_ASM_000263 /TAXON_ID=37353 /ORGANISM="Rosalina sp." /LENGTH=76 /DNA_ID=CAMNT_0047992265 /DNA_START=61 /DNA_END=291 /DNA_ORIENTATION=-